MKKNFIIDILLLFSLGAASSISLPPLNIFIINFFTFSIFFIFLFKKLNLGSNKRFFFIYGWIFGLGYFMTNLYWITISLTFDETLIFLIPLALIIVPSFLALFYGVVTLIYYQLSLKSLLSSFFLFSLLFGITEFIRGNILTGFPWNLIVYSFSKEINFINIVSIIGSYSLNLFVISFFTAPAIFFLKRSKIEIFVSVFILSLSLLFFSYGTFQKKQFYKEEIKKNPFIIRIIGSNITLDRFKKKFHSENILGELIRLSAPDKDKKIFFLWPEGIVTDTYLDEINLYQDLFSKNFNENHLIGLGITSRLFNKNENIYFNSFAIIDSNLNLIKNYNKINLVPFGEFLPIENFLNNFGLKTITNDFGSFSKGNNRSIIKVGKNLNQFSFLPLICYEIIYSGKLSKNFDFDFIFNISEDGWFGKSIGPKQHFAHSIFRAIESGKYVIRSSNNGKSAIINPLGEIEDRIDYGNSGFIDFINRRDLESTLFSKYGNKIFFILILLYIFLIFSFNRFKNE